MHIQITMISRFNNDFKGKIIVGKAKPLLFEYACTLSSDEDLLSMSFSRQVMSTPELAELDIIKTLDEAGDTGINTGINGDVNGGANAEKQEKREQSAKDPDEVGKSSNVGTHNTNDFTHDLSLSASREQEARDHRVRERDFPNRMFASKH